MTEFRMPSLGADMEAGTLVQWLKHPGETLARGDVIAVVDTEKGAIEIEVFEDGILDAIVVDVGQKVPVGTVLARIRQAGEPTGAVPATASSGPSPRATPGARKAATELHIDLTSVTGTGPAGTVTREDVDRAASRGRLPAPALPVAPPPDRAGAMRHAVAASMTRAKREIPHLYLANTVDVTGTLTWLAADNEKRPIDQRRLLIALLVKAVALAARDVPDVNGFWTDDSFHQSPAVHVGCAIALRDGGLVAPAIHDADRKDLGAVMHELSELVARARAGGLRSSELSDPTITVTNLGELGVESAFAIIHPPQVAIVAFGRPVQRPWVVNDAVMPRTLVTVSVSADHRAVDGRRAGQFLAAIERWLQQPEAL
jgi:pyruvate dehydrogenase E2 component (dihydrolipoamide acetyltransferase)